jgi:methionyl-tRNA formyltransferase
VLTEPVRPDDTTGTLLDRLSHWEPTFVATLDGIEDALSGRPAARRGRELAQDHPPTRGWTGSCPAWVDRQVRACPPTRVPGPSLTASAWARPGRPEPGDPGPGRAARWPCRIWRPASLQAARNAVLVGTGSRPVLLGDVQAPGKRRMTAPEWARGLRSGGPVRFG